MMNQNLLTGVLLFLCLWAAVSGCGSEEAVPGTGPALPREEIPTCKTLEPRVLEDPLSGGAFHCLWCNQEWEWTVPARNDNLFLLIALTCERLRSTAYLEVEDPRRSVVWRREVRQGDSTTYCIRHEAPSGGTLSVGLRGSGILLPATDLIKEFRGSVYIKVFNEQGDLSGDPEF